MSTQRHRVSEGFVVPFTLPATVTAAVHHRCITATAFDGLPRNRGPTRTPSLSQIWRQHEAWDEESGLQACYGKPWKRAFFYRSVHGLVTVRSGSLSAVSLEPLGAGALGSPGARRSKRMPIWLTVAILALTALIAFKDLL